MVSCAHPHLLPVQFYKTTVSTYAISRLVELEFASTLIMPFAVNNSEVTQPLLVPQSQEHGTDHPPTYNHALRLTILVPVIE